MTAFFDDSVSPKPRFPWYPLGLVVLFLFAAGLRFWGLERFNTLVFDEVYYTKFANNYLTQTAFFDGHPPLSKYIIAASIWLAEQWHLGPNIGNELAGTFRTTWSYRWSAALTGSFIPIVVAELVRQVSQNRRFALIAGSFVALDGLFLVESRYALNNVYLVIFGLLGQLGLVLAARTLAQRAQRLARSVTTPISPIGWRLRFWLWMIGSGVSFAAAASIKWNGLWFLLGAYGCLAIGWLYRLVAQRNLQAAQRLRLLRKMQTARQAEGTSTTENIPDLQLSPNFQFPNLETAPTIAKRLKFQRSLFWHLGQIHPIAVILCLGILPCLVYALIWIPHLQLNSNETFWGLQQQILSYHQNVKSGKAVHPYCSD
ncbi:phospholipid carrier-dependent glycosyltransferase, partial [filamentous cyanobacterium LEGE 11480]